MEVAAQLFSNGSDDAAAAGARLRSSDEYQATHAYMQELGSALGASTNVGDWHTGGEVQINYARVGAPPTKEAQEEGGATLGAIHTYYRQNGRYVYFKFHAVLPDQGLLTGLFALCQEGPFWPIWHPLISAPGPIELAPRRKFRTLFSIKYTLAFLKGIELALMDFDVDHEKGVAYVRLTAFPATDKLWEAHPAPAWHKRSYSNILMVIKPQHHTTYVSFTVTSWLELVLPTFVIRLLCSYVLPELVVCMSRDALQARRSSSPHYDVIQRDSFGLYAECARLEADAKAAGDGPVFTGASPIPTAELVDRPHGIVSFEAAQSPLRESVAATASSASPQQDTLL
eukprot:NODE_11698_length_1270_cov_7.209974.p1 GENE.NODE_11698_length_1270_cov_7.209974~~NODE_11698_length_1270_cov_7.209974.p1  ORF type:complete len:377 (-),score=52.80 NODE_11698_length_1270_cov_7.209974:140-1165(-)